MRKFSTSDLIGYAVFAALFLAVAGLRPAHAADAGVRTAATAGAVATPMKSRRE
ncbi:MAG: hypothetical protein WDM81_21140 [Rhizomicrobium sp.]